MKKITVLLIISLPLLIAGCQKKTPTTQTTNLGNTNQTQTEQIKQVEPVTPEIPIQSPKYVAYEANQVVAAAQTGKAVLFFHAAWCPTCQAAEKDFSQNIDKVPDDVTIFKTDYDTQTELKKKYNITYQHTFVQVDEQGNEITKWNGGGVDELAQNVR